MGALLALLASCQTPAGTLYMTTLSQPDGSNQLPVTLGDETGLVTGIEPAMGTLPPSNEAHLEAVPNEPRSFIVSWFGGACDNDVAVAFQRHEANFILHVRMHKKVGLGCTGNALLRALRIGLSEPVPVSLVTPILSG